MQVTFNITRGHMMSTFKTITLGLLLGFGIQFLFAWTAPGGSAPTGNVAGPLTTGGNQIKTGSLRVDGGLTAPMMVDSNDTNYTINPSSLSVLSSLQVTNLIAPNCDVKTDVNGNLVCGTDQTAGNTLNNFSCPNNQVVSGFDSSGKPICKVVGGIAYIVEPEGEGNALYHSAYKGHLLPRCNCDKKIDNGSSGNVVTDCGASVFSNGKGVVAWDSDGGFYGDDIGSQCYDHVLAVLGNFSVKYIRM